MPSNEQGIAGTVLVIVIAWALAAVLMLTVTLVAAQDISDTVGQLPDPEEGSVLNEVVDIDGNLGPVALATEIERTSADILTAAEPLEGQLDQVLDATDQIDASARSILSTAGDIDSSVNSIDASAGEINSSVASIRDRLASVDGTVDSIRDGVAGINNRADSVISLARSIQSDTDAIRFEVLEREPTDDGIRGHAHSIDCRLAGDACERGVSGGELPDLPGLDAPN